MPALSWVWYSIRPLPLCNQGSLTKSPHNGPGDNDLPDHRKHRGPHPEDQKLFATEQLPSLRGATNDLSWLLTRDYPSTSALKIVGDRYCLDARQRMAVARCSCGDADVNRRKQHEVQIPDLSDQEVWIDGYNVLTSIEAALSGGVILHARDNCYRDMASMHGSYRKVEETIPALQIVGGLLVEWKVAESCWLLDQPVSNSGRLKIMVQELASEHGWNWRTEVVPDPDDMLIATDRIVASADSQILNQATRWFNMARVTIDSRVSDAWVVDLSK